MPTGPRVSRREGPRWPALCCWRASPQGAWGSRRLSPDRCPAGPRLRVESGHNYGRREPAREQRAGAQCVFLPPCHACFPAATRCLQVLVTNGVWGKAGLIESKSPLAQDSPRAALPCTEWVFRSSRRVPRFPVLGPACKVLAYSPQTRCLWDQHLGPNSGRCGPGALSGSCV